MVTKKMLAIMVVALLFLIAAPVSAEETQGRDVFSFCELYTQRLTKFESMTGEEISAISDYYYNDLGIDDMVSCAAGSFSIDTNKWTIKEFQTDIYTANSESNANRMMSAIIAISALEYGKSDEVTLKYLENSDPINKSYEIFYEYIKPYLNDELKNGEAKEVYSGKYTYYLDYFCIPDQDVEVVYLIAK